MKFDTGILESLFPTVLFSTNSDGIHLTFDDGPHPDGTLNILNILKSRGVSATFFLVGENILKYPELALQIKSEGHQIGNHSYTHTNLFFKNNEIIKKEILETENILESIIGHRTHFFRPPYGYFNSSMLRILKDLGMTCVIWNINSKDFKLNSHLNNILNRVIRKAVGGSILLFHDNDNVAKKCNTYLPIVLDKLLENGLVFKTLPI
jgi:peptidoglycan/xylan/chitin deacetylase (PgdA/CDA1 family)